VGGTQLDFRISEEEMRKQEEQLDVQIAKAKNTEEKNNLIVQKQSLDAQKANLMEAIRQVLERRINALGVSEATITPSYVGDEKHLLVECPGVVDTQECIKVVGKTIQLEFKEEFTTPTDDFIKETRAKASATLKRITQSGTSLKALGQDLGSELGVSYQETRAVFKDELPKGLESVWNQAPGKVVSIEGSVDVPTDATGQKMETVPGIFLVEVTGPKFQTGRVLTDAPKAFTYITKTETGTTYGFKDKVTLDSKVNTRIAGTLRGMQGGELKSVSMEDGSAHLLFLRGIQKGQEAVEVSHILVSYKGANSAAATVTRTKEQALARAKDLKNRLNQGAKFADLAKAESDGPSAKDGGSLGTITRNEMPPTFEEVAFRQSAGTVSDPVETQFGYHLIRTDKAKSVQPDIASYDDLAIKGANALKRADALITKLKDSQVKEQQEAIGMRTLFFSLQPTGWKDTTLDGKHFRSAAVSLDPVTNIPVVQILFDTEGAKIFQQLTKANKGKRIAIFVGGQLVSAPMVQEEISGGTAVITGSANIQEAKALAQDLNTGAIPAPIHLVGQYTVEATLGATALRTSLMAALIGTIILMIYMLLVYRLLGLMADIALFIYAVLFFALLKLPILLITSNYVVLTLAGMAGIILSIGMAVDANVLVFERMKEELRKGKSLKSATEASFVYAWPAIRDSNVSAIITCVILFLIGTSIVRGFAVTLGMGVVISLFTAVFITRWLLRKLAANPIADRKELFGVSSTTQNQ
jgi:protein-export membrane protein SecD